MEIKTPDLGVDANEVTAIYVKSGDIVISGDDIVLLDSEKYTVKVQTTLTGRVNNVMVSLGDIVSEGVVLLDIEVGDEEYAHDCVYADDEDSSYYNDKQSSNGQSDSFFRDDKQLHRSEFILNDLQHSADLNNANVSTQIVPEMFDIAILDSILPDAIIKKINADAAENKHTESNNQSTKVPTDTAVDTQANTQREIEFLEESVLEAESPNTSDAVDLGNISDKNNVNEKNNVSAYSSSPLVVADLHAASNKATNNSLEQPKLNDNSSLPMNVLDKRPAYAGPLVRGLARQMGVNIDEVDGTAGKKRILKNDLFNYVKQNMQKNALQVTKIAKESNIEADSAAIGIESQHTDNTSNIDKFSIDIDDNSCNTSQLEADTSEDGNDITQVNDDVVISSDRNNDRNSDVNTYEINEKNAELAVAKTTDFAGDKEVIKETVTGSEDTDGSLDNLVLDEIAESKEQKAIASTNITASEIALLKTAKHELAISENSLQNANSDNTRQLVHLPDMTEVELWGDVETVDLSVMQQKSVNKLKQQPPVPQVTQFENADITELQDFCNEFKEQYAKQGVKLSILPFIVKATAKSLLKHAKFNSHYNESTGKMILRKSINIGISISTQNGVLVPVIRNVQDKSVRNIAIELEELTSKAFNNQLTKQETAGASFTIAPLGKMGGIGFTPLVNWPQVGIIGISESSMQPKWNETTSSFDPKLTLPISISYDYRVIHEADVELFIRHFISLLEDIRKVLL